MHIDKHRKRIFLHALVLFGAFSLLLSQIPSAAANPIPMTPLLQVGEPPEPSISNDYCLGCHAKPDLYGTLPSSEQLYLTVDPTVYQLSTHGRGGYACVQCHTDITEFPHPENTAQDRREFVIQQNLACQQCHYTQYEANQDSVHQRAIDNGNTEAAVCSDCHGAHDVSPPDIPRSRVPQTCQRCHSEIFTRYEQSVHGSALLGTGNPDVPSCTDCHGEHSIQGPTDSQFKLFSPQLCAECHADDELMEEYGISTNVFNSYISDFHGSTVTLFEATAPDQQTNKPVCIDCHGVHDIRSSDDPDSAVIKENLLATCQKCHPDATADFPDAWLSHYEPSQEQWPIVYYVNVFYRFFIPIILGGMIVFVLIEGGSKIVKRGKKKTEPKDE